MPMANLPYIHRNYKKTPAKVSIRQSTYADEMLTLASQQTEVEGVVLTMGGLELMRPQPGCGPYTNFT